MKRSNKTTPTHQEQQQQQQQQQQQHLDSFVYPGLTTAPRPARELVVPPCGVRKHGAIQSGVTRDKHIKQVRLLTQAAAAGAVTETHPPPHNIIIISSSSSHPRARHANKMRTPPRPPAQRPCLHRLELGANSSARVVGLEHCIEVPGAAMYERACARYHQPLSSSANGCDVHIQ